MRKVKYIISLIVILTIATNINAQKRYYFEADDTRCKSDEAFYYKDITKVGSKYKVKEYYAANDQLKSMGSYLTSDGDPKERDGNFEAYYDNGQKEFEVRFKRGNEEGDYISYYKNGKEKSKGKYFGGKRNGEWVIYYENGQIKGQGKYFVDEYDSDWSWFYDDGSKEKEARYKSGRKDGFLRTFHKNGKPYINAIYESDSLTGYYNEYWDNGNKAAYGKYFNNKKDSIWNWYHTNGKQSARAIFTKGVFENGIFYNEEGEEMSKRVRSEKDLIKNNQYSGGAEAIIDEINRALSNTIDLKAVKKYHYTAKIVFEIVVDKEGKVIKRTMLSPDENKDFKDPHKVIETVQTTVNAMDNFTPKRAYNRYVEGTIILEVKFDGYTQELALATNGLETD